MTASSLIMLVALALIAVVASSGTAHAYLDAGTSSLILQLVLAGVGGIAVLVKVFWQRLTGLFGIRKDEE